jgi:hypothetical protein
VSLLRVEAGQARSAAASAASIVFFSSSVSARRVVPSVSQPWPEARFAASQPRSFATSARV